MTIVIAGILRKVLGGSKQATPSCPYRIKPIRCKGRLQLLTDENGKTRQHHGGWMPESPNSTRIRPDTGKDPVAKIEAFCPYCLHQFWGRSLETISNMFKGKPGFLHQDGEQWKNTIEVKAMRRFPHIFPEEQIRKAEEMAHK